MALICSEVMAKEGKRENGRSQEEQTDGIGKFGKKNKQGEIN
jgi:hypothetical protein